MRGKGMWAVVAAAALVGCGNGEGGRDVGDVGDVGEQAGPTLMVVMRGLETDMDRASHALWAGRMDSLAVAARAVADHPQVSAGERGRIMGILGERGPAFAAADRRVHDQAVALAERAGEGDEAGAVRALGTLQEGCVACHREFREVVRAGVAPAGPAPATDPGP